LQKPTQYWKTNSLISLCNNKPENTSVLEIDCQVQEDGFRRSFYCPKVNMIKSETLTWSTEFSQVEHIFLYNGLSLAYFHIRLYYK